MYWFLGTLRSPSMNPGRACFSCHGQGGAPTFTLAGTVYPTGHEPDLCYGANGNNGVQVVITGADGQVVTLTPADSGNFNYTGALAFPFHAKVTYTGRERAMSAAQMSGDCNGCHTQTGANGAPGRIVLP
jgi:cytochrome c553